MSNSFRDLLSFTVDQIFCRHEVELILKDLVYHVEIFSNHQRINELLEDLESAKKVGIQLLHTLDTLDQEKKVIQASFSDIKSKSIRAREKFVLQIGTLLRSSRQISIYQTKIDELKMKLREVEEVKNNSIEDIKKNKDIITNKNVTTNKDLEVITESSSLPLVKIKMSALDKILKLDNETILNTFSYLNTIEVLNFAQSCRMMFKRVNQLFGMESLLKMESWESDYQNSTSSHSKSVQDKKEKNSNHLITNGNHSDTSSTARSSPSNTSISTPLNGQFPIATNITPSVQTIGSVTPINLTTPTNTSSNHQSPNPAAQSGLSGITREMAESLSKKLNPSELKAIVAISDLMKRQASELAAAKEEKELVESKLQTTEAMRDFLVDKLRSAENALKAALSTTQTLKRQAAADQEVISFLDLRGQELETARDALVRENERLRALLDLQSGRHSHMENRLQAELAETKAKLEEQTVSGKAMRKRLVEEVKSLRSQIERIGSERQLYRSQLQALRDALLSADPSHASKT